MKADLIEHIEYLTDKSNKFKQVEERYSIAVNRWFLCGGDLPSSQIAKYLDINHNKLTLLIQKRMEIMTGIELKDNAPDIEVVYSEKDLERLYPKSYRFEWRPVYELDYYLYLANNSRSQIIHNYKLFLNESRSRDLQSNIKVSVNQVS
jgi:hypothetical protein